MTIHLHLAGPGPNPEGPPITRHTPAQAYAGIQATRVLVRSGKGQVRTVEQIKENLPPEDLVGGALAQLAEVARHEADDGAEGSEAALEGTRRSLVRVELLVELLGVQAVLAVDDARALVARQGAASAGGRPAVARLGEADGLDVGELRGAAARHELEVRDDAGLIPGPLARVLLEEGRGLVGGHQVREDAEDLPVVGHARLAERALDDGRDAVVPGRPHALAVQDPDVGEEDVAEGVDDARRVLDAPRDVGDHARALDAEVGRGDLGELAVREGRAAHRERREPGPRGLVPRRLGGAVGETVDREVRELGLVAVLGDLVAVVPSLVKYGQASHTLSLTYMAAPHSVASAPSQVEPSGQAVHTLLRTYLIESHTVAAAPSQVKPLGQAVHFLFST